MSITEPMDIYAAGIQDSMMQQAIMVLFMMVAAFIGLYFVTSRLVLRPIDELRSAAGAVGKGDFNYPSRCRPRRAAPRRAGGLTGEFDRMARDLEALYADLEGQVRSKTDDLMVLNDMLNYQKRDRGTSILGEVAYKNEFFAIVSTSCARRSPAFGLRAHPERGRQPSAQDPRGRGRNRIECHPFAEHGEQHPRHFQARC